MAPRYDTLIPRTTTTRKTTNAVGIIIIVCLALLAIGAIFCIVVAIIICKNKRQRKLRERKMEASKPSQSSYRALGSSEAVGGGDANQRLLYDGNVPLGEMEARSPFSDRERVQGGTPQQLDSHPVPARFEAAGPIELPSEAVTNDTRR